MEELTRNDSDLRCRKCDSNKTKQRNVQGLDSNMCSHVGYNHMGGCSRKVFKPLFVFVVCIVFQTINGFNLDTEKFVEFQGDNPGSYFGYSVAMVNLDARNQWLLFGAPKDNSAFLPDAKEPGTIYKCTILQDGNGHSCLELFVDNSVGVDSARFDGMTRIFEHGHDNQWLGATIDVQSNRGVVTCASRWYNTYYLDDGYYLMNGICYELPLDLNRNNIRTIPALINGTQQTEKVNNVTKYLYGMGGLGMSAHYTEQGNDLLLGAPGLRTWTGGFVDLRQSEVFFPQYIRKATEISEMLGYAMTSGEYFGNGLTYFAIGAPREELTGKVFLYRGNRRSYVVENADTTLTGTEGKINEMPVNSFFGAALCTCDVNKDGRDDLLVSAPFFSNTDAQDVAMEEGVVFVYLGVSDLTFKLMPELLTGSGATRARFGTAMACLGDLNKDKYNDVIIGAPYEDDMQGAIYIYNGCKTGVWPSYSQRIPAAKIGTGLTSFGISFSKAVDMNNDEVNDIAVGAYLSDRAYLMFGQSVVNVNISLTTDTTLIDMATDTQCRIPNGERQPCFVIKVCFRYLNADFPYIDVLATTKLDVLMGNYPRLVFLKNHQGLISESARLFTAENVCKSQIVYVKSSTDLVTPVLLRSTFKNEGIFNALYIPPSLNIFDGENPNREVLVATKMIQFKKDCPNNECNTDLTLNADASFDGHNDFFVLGKPTLSLDVKISKTGDPSYSSNLFIAFPKNLRYQRVNKHYGDPDVNCGYVSDPTEEKEEEKEKEKNLLADLVSQNIPSKTEDEYMLVCFFGNPLYNNTGVSFSVIMGVPDTVTDTEFNFRFNTTTLSTEIKPSDNVKTVTVNVRNQVDVDFKGVSLPSSIRIDSPSITYMMTHTFELRNRGPSQLPSASLTIRYPQVLRGGKPILYLNKTTWSCVPPCNISCSFTENPSSSPVVYSAGIGPTYYTNKSPSMENIGESRQLKDINTVNCRSENCAGYLCSLSNIPARESAVASLDFVIDGSILDVISDGQARTAVSDGYVKLRETRRLITPETIHSREIPTQILPLAQPPQKMPWWVYLLSVLGGIFFIIILVIILWRCGFFRRKDREALMKMQHTGEVQKMLSDDDKS